MSRSTNPALHDGSDPTRRSHPVVSDASIIHRLGHQVIPAFRTLAFWTAVGLPAVYFPMLIAGVETTEALWVFLGLMGIHFATIVAGHAHRRTE